MTQKLIVPLGIIACAFWLLAFYTLHLDLEAINARIDCLNHRPHQIWGILT